MNTYLDLTTARIHHYLERTQALRLIRGASALLAQATDVHGVADTLTKRWPRGCVTVCDSAGRSESIIHLEVDCRCGSCHVEHVATWWLAELRNTVPAADFRAKWGQATTYSEFASSESTHVIESPCPDLDLFMVEQCNDCRRGYAAGPRRQCVDCRARHDAADRRSSASAEQRLLERLQLGDSARPTEFAQLAALGAGQRAGSSHSAADRKTNHLATVYIDGNGFRAMFSAAGRIPSEQRFAVDDLSIGIADAAWTALEAAARAVLDVHRRNGGADDDLPLIPHVVAADDLCVSVPASYAWTFVRAYCTAFGDSAVEAVRHAGRNWVSPTPTRPAPVVTDLVPPATASGSIVFARHTEPFSHLLQLGEDLLKVAKRAARGEKASVMWLDVSRDGPQPPPWRAPVMLDAFPTDLVRELAAQGASLRRQLHDDATTPDPADARARVRARAQRLGLLERHNTPAIADHLRNPDFDPAALDAALSIAEWWTE